MYFLKKLKFTLMEILIVILILTSILSVTGIKIYDLYKEQQFLSESQQVLNKLQTAQDLMLLIDTDVFVYLAKNKGKKEIICYLEVQKPLEDRWAKMLEKPLTLHAIQEFEFKGTSEDKLKLQFINSALSQGTLKLYRHNQKKNENQDQAFEIELLGYPFPLKQKSQKEEKKIFIESSQSLYPELVYEKFYKA